MGHLRRAGFLLALLVLAGCGDERGSPLSESIEGRRRLPSCGSYVVPLGELAANQRSIRDCFVAAFEAGEPMEVTLTTTTVEGDPIVTIYRVLGRHDLELFVDSSADRFAAEDLAHLRCRTLAEAGNGLLADACSTVS